MLKGQISRRAMELGGFPVRSDNSLEIQEVRNSWDDLMATMRKIDPDLAHMIESLAPIYLVKG